MLVASQKDMDWCKKEAVAAYSRGSGVKPAQDRRIFGMAAVAHVARNLATGEVYTAALQDPNYERFAYPVPPITVGGLTQMVVLRKAIADGTAKPGDIAAFEQISARPAPAPSAIRTTRCIRFIASCTGWPMRTVAHPDRRTRCP
jgi:hypothetical protein